MRAHLIYEKFTDESDPIRDLGIGVSDELIKKYISSLGLGSFPKENYLWICAKEGKTSYVKYLIDNGENVHEYDDVAFRWACKFGHVETVKALLDAGANIHAFSDEGIHYARALEDKTLYKMIMKYKRRKNKIKESLNEKFTDDSDPIKDMGIGIKYAIKDFVENHDTRNLYRDKRWGTGKEDYLWICARAGKTSFVEYLLSTGEYDIHDRDDFAFRWACKYNCIATVKVLLNAGANIYAHSHEGIEYTKQHKNKTLYNILMKHIKKLNKI